MKKTTLAVAIVLLSLAGYVSYSWSSTNNYVPTNEQKVSQSIDCNDPDLTPAEKKQCAQERHCQVLWAIQPWLEKYIIPILQDVARLLKSDCLYNLLGILFDSAFWVPLACDCNQEANACTFWRDDLKYNLDTLDSSCK